MDGGQQGDPDGAVAKVDWLLSRSPLQSFFSRRASRRLAVLAYHGIEHAERFGEQLNFIRKHSQPVSLDEVIAAGNRGAGLPGRAVLITFDDGDRSVLELGMPLLLERGLPAVAFVIAGHLDSATPYWWVEVEELVRAGGIAPGYRGVKGPNLVRALKLVPDDRRLAVMGELRRTSGGPPPKQAHLRSKDLQTLESAGIAVGNHTMTHPCLPRCPEERALREVAEAHDVLAQAIGRPTRAFAYPNGDRDPRAERLLLDLGYEAAFLFDHRLNDLRNFSNLQISRLRVRSTTSLDRLRIVLSGLHPALHDVRTRARRLPAVPSR